MKYSSLEFLITFASKKKYIRHYKKIKAIKSDGFILYQSII